MYNNKFLSCYGTWYCLIVRNCRNKENDLAAVAVVKYIIKVNKIFTQHSLIARYPLSIVVAPT